MTQDKIITIRLNEKEKDKLEKSGQNHGLSAGRYLKKKALDIPFVQPVFDFETGRKIYRDISLQGVNINQIATRLNSISNLSESELINLMSKLEEIDEGYQKIWQSLQR